MSEPHVALAELAAREESRVRILAIDPGPTESAYVYLEDGVPSHFAKLANNVLLSSLRLGLANLSIVVIEKVASYGMAVGAEVFETVYWSGRFAEACRASRVQRITRKEVVTHLCGSAKANDANVRAALIDRFGGQETAIGRKGAYGPLHGMNSDHRAALAVAVTWLDTHEGDR